MSIDFHICPSVSGRRQKGREAKEKASKNQFSLLFVKKNLFLPGWNRTDAIYRAHQSFARLLLENGAFH